MRRWNSPDLRGGSSPLRRWNSRMAQGELNAWCLRNAIRTTYAMPTARRPTETSVTKVPSSLLGLAVNIHEQSPPRCVAL